MTCQNCINFLQISRKQGKCMAVQLYVFNTFKEETKIINPIVKIYYQCDKFIKINK